MAEVALPVADRTGIAAAGEDERILVATQWQLIWWRFRKHYLAVGGSVVVILFYLVAFNADFLSYSDPFDSHADRSHTPPQPIFWFEDGVFRPHVYRLKGSRNTKTFVRDYEADPNDKIYLRLFGSGFRYKILGFIQTDIHLFGVVGERPEETLFILGTDIQGRDLWSRLINATRISLFIGLAGVTISLFLGILLGGLSGFYGGFVDTVIQRIIEISTIHTYHPLMDGTGGGDAKRLGHTQSLLCHYHHYLVDRLDRPRSGRSRQVPVDSGGGFRDGGRARRRQPAANHLSPHGSGLSQPHHRLYNPGHPLHDHRRDFAQLLGVGAATAGDQLGGLAPGRPEYSGPRHYSLAADSGNSRRFCYPCLQFHGRWNKRCGRPLQLIEIERWKTVAGHSCQYKI